MNRRDLLKGALAVAGLAAVPVRAEPPRQARILVLLELAGGNDGLNTLIPYTDPEYYRLRPTLAVPRERVAALTEMLGLHPSLGSLRPLWEARELAVIQGVGYPAPNRSHFRSIDIWNTASDSNQILSDGWLAPGLKAMQSRHEAPMDAVVLDGRPQAVQGTGARVIAMSDPEDFMRKAAGSFSTEVGVGGPALGHLVATWQAAKQAADYLEARLSPTGAVQDEEVGGQLSQQFGHVARLIEAGVDVPVYKISLKGFDTHAEQADTHAALLAELADALRAFQARMKAAGRWRDVLLVTYSEFGRRVAENGSRGTDHGTASAAFALGGSVKGGLYGVTPSLTDLIDGDLRFQLDYRSVYATVLHGWFGLDPALLPNGPMPPLDLFA